MPAAASLLDDLPGFAGAADPAQAARLVRFAAEHTTTPAAADALLRSLSDGLLSAPEPRRALLGFERWVGQLISPSVTCAALDERPWLAHDLLYLFGGSPFLTDILVREPELYTLLGVPPGAEAAADYPALVEQALAAAGQPSARVAALRRLKRREYLRIAWRDLLAHAAFGSTVERISDLAEALIAASLRIAVDEIAGQMPTLAALVRVAVIGMGKLGGRELNYSSDVDLLFVYDSPDPHDARQQLFARRVCERLIAILAEESADGRLFRVDMRLRPEGRSGELVRSLAGYRQYYDRWVETWERQALIKARAVAGDPALGGAFCSLAAATAYGRRPDGSLLEDVRDVKMMMERRTELDGERLNVKEGRGTIRDVEFAVQLLQLLGGGDDPGLRVGTTLTALGELQAREMLTAGEARTLRRGYQFFRRIEHRLQLEEDLPVRHLPVEPERLTWLARLSGYRSPSALKAACGRAADSVRAACDRVYARLGGGAGGTERVGEDLRPWILSLGREDADQAIERFMAGEGFRQASASLAVLKRLAVATGGMPHAQATRRLFADLAPGLLAAAAASADPDAALATFQELADRTQIHRSFYQRFLDEPGALGDLCRLAGAGPALAAVLVRYPEYVETALDRELLAQRMSPAELALELDQRLVGAVNLTGRLAALRRFRLRHLIRLGARELLGSLPWEETAAEWSSVADACVAGALRVAGLSGAGREEGGGPGSFAVIGLGRLGGNELLFPSDLDLFYLFDEPGADPRRYEALARSLQDALQAVTREGELFSIDLRLRPEGRSGFLASSLAACQRYFSGRALEWEAQAFLKARIIAGAEEVGARFLSWLEPVVYPPGAGESWTASLREMKLRIERERTDPQTRERDLKLGPGGLSDVEFLVQWLQRLHGHARREIRPAGTAAALEAIGSSGLLPADEVAALQDGYAFQSRLRQRIWLAGDGESADVLPSDPVRLEVIARALDTTAGSLAVEFDEVRQRVRRTYLRYLGER